MLIAGGCYLERCHYPDWDRLFGSGLRAALAVSRLSPGSSLSTYATQDLEPDIRASLEPYHVTVNATRSHWQKGWFEWLHPFDLIASGRVPDELEPSLLLKGDALLRFGMQEGEAVVDGARVVYDPQSRNPKVFSQNGSKAEELALILSPQELVLLVDPAASDVSDATVNRAMLELFQSPVSCPTVLLLKDGYGGITLCLSEDTKLRVPTYAAESFFKIGSGDVLAAAFAHFWAEKKLPAREAANLAARCVAFYVDGARLPLPVQTDDLPTAHAGLEPEKIRILNSPGVAMGTLLLHTEAWLRRFGKDVVMAEFEKPFDKDKELPTLIMLDHHASPGELIQFANLVAEAPYYVVFWQGPMPERAGGYFPEGVIKTDFASALYHMMRGG